MVVVRGEAKRSHVRKYRTTMVKGVRVLLSRRTCEPIGTTTTTTTTTEKRNTPRVSLSTETHRSHKPTIARVSTDSGPLTHHATIQL